MRCVRLSFQQLMQTEALISLSDVAWSGTNSRLPQRGWANCPQLWQVNGEENRVNVLSQGPQRLPMCLMVIVKASVSIRGKPGWSQLGGLDVILKWGAAGRKTIVRQLVAGFGIDGIQVAVTRGREPLSLVGKGAVPPKEIKESSCICLFFRLQVA